MKLPGRIALSTVSARTARRATCGAIVALGTLLSGCGDDSSDASPTTVSSSDAVTGTLPMIKTTADIQDALAGTPWECQRWSTLDDGLASCIVDNGQDELSIHAIYLKERPGETAAVIFQSGSDTPAVIIGGNWVFDCGPGTSLGVDRCGEIATALDGLVVLPESG